MTSLYLSRIALNPLFGPAIKLAANPYQLHRSLVQTVPITPSNAKPAVPEQPRTGDILFRVDATPDGPVILMQSAVAPNWDRFERAPRALRCEPQTKEFSPEFRLGQRLGFRLLCQPSMRKSLPATLREDGKRLRGPRLACRTDEERLAWLKRRSDRHGFQIETVGITHHKWANSKPLQARDGKVIEEPEEARKRAFRAGRDEKTAQLGATRFDGVLIVRDPAALAEAVARGIGPGKAFGFGLLSLAPA